MIVDVEFVKVKIRVFMTELIALMSGALGSHETSALLVANMILALFAQNPKKRFGRM